jgi:sirohydrochlorin ferrochelatase
MKPNDKMFVISVIFLCWTLCLPAVTKAQDRGVILVAHGSTSQIWNTQVRDLEKRIINNLPSQVKAVKLAFLRFDQPTLEDAVYDLRDNEKVTDILIVHLSPSSHSERHKEIFDRIEVIIEESDQSLDLKVSPAMNDHLEIIKILKEYAADLSRDPEYESLILVSYGATNELFNIAEIRQLEQIGKKIQTDLGFREVVCLTLRNHAPDLIRAQAIVDLQRTARRLKEKGRVIVVPYVLSILPNDSFQRELWSHLTGIVSPKYIGDKGILQSVDKNGLFEVDPWVREVIEQEIHEPKFKDANRTWSVMDKEKGVPIGTNKYQP